MTAPAVIEIVGSTVACAQGVQDTWRELAQWMGEQLHRRYGPAVNIVYYDLFDANCPPLPEGAQLPFVLINGEVLSSGGKLSMPAIRRRLETLGVATHA